MDNLRKIENILRQQQIVSKKNIMDVLDKMDQSCNPIVFNDKVNFLYNSLTKHNFLVHYVLLCPCCQTMLTESIEITNIEKKKLFCKNCSVVYQSSKLKYDTILVKEK